MQLSSAAQLLGAAYHVSSLADAAAVGPALKALVESELPQPLAATLASPRITGSQQVHFLSTHSQPDNMCCSVWNSTSAEPYAELSPLQTVPSLDALVHRIYRGK